MKKTMFVFVLFVGVMFLGCSKTTTSTLTINNIEVGEYYIYIYPNSSMPTDKSNFPNKNNDAIAIGHVSYWFSNKNNGEIPKVELNWPKGVLSGNFLIEVEAGFARGYTISSFNKGNTTINFNDLTVISSLK